MSVRAATKWVVVGALLVLVAASCAQQPEDTASDALTLGSVPKTVQGNVVSIPVTSPEDIEIVKADGDTSQKSGHFHVFIDREPVGVGKAIPKNRNVVHSADNPVKIYGLKKGTHTFHVVLGDGVHERFGEHYHTEAKVKVLGPSVWGKAKSSIDEGDDLDIALYSQGVDIVTADGKSSAKTGHYHVFVDPKTPPAAGKVIAPAEENKIIHTPDDSTVVSGLKKGEHTLWIVLGDGTHRAVDPPVMDKLTVTVA